MAKAPTPGRTRERPTLRVGFNETSWTFKVGEVTPRDVADLRRDGGVTMRQALAAFNDKEADLDSAAAIIFLARRQSESRTITFDDATAGLTYDSELTVEVVDDEDGESHPEA